MMRRDSFSGAANFIDLLAGLFLVLLVAFAFYLFGMRKIAAQAAEEQRKRGGLTAAQLAAAQTEAAVGRFRDFLSAGSETGGYQTAGGAPGAPNSANTDGGPSVPRPCDAAFSPTIASLAPGLIRMEFGQSLFASAETVPVLHAQDCLRRLGLALAADLTSRGGTATTANPIEGSPCVDIQIQAHADAKPVDPAQNRSFKDNLDLSALRAIETERIMINDLPSDVRAVWASRVSVAGYGDRRPKVGVPPEADENRRVWVQLQWRWNEEACRLPPASFSENPEPSSWLQVPGSGEQPRALPLGSPSGKNTSVHNSAASPARTPNAGIASAAPSIAADEDAPASPSQALPVPPADSQGDVTPPSQSPPRHP